MRNPAPLFVFQQGRGRQQTLQLRLADGRNIQKIFFTSPHAYRALRHTGLTSSA
jgi:hypothetical protein